MSWSPPTLDAVLRARRAITPHLPTTPVLDFESIDAILGSRASLKCEHLLPTGAFKVRGGVHLLAGLPEDERRRGVLAVSTGNHAQSIAYAARLHQTRAVIFMPANANPVKLAATRAYGAEVIQAGEDFDAARAAAEEHARLNALRYIHSTNEPALVEGVATAALEFFETEPALDVLFVPLGGGSGAIGAGSVARAISPQTKVIAVQSAGAPAVYRSWKEGRRVTTDGVDTIAEGLATRSPFELTLALLPQVVDEVMLVDDSELIAAVRVLIHHARQVVEPSGAAGLAAALQRRAEFAGRHIGVMLTGANISPDLLLRILTA